MLLHVGPAPWATPADVRGLYVKGMITGPLTSPAWTVVPASKKPKPNAAAAVLLTLWLPLLVMVPVISMPSHGSIESAASRAAIYGCRCQYAGRKSTNTLSLPRQWKGRFEDIRQRPWRKGPGGEKYSLYSCAQFVGQYRNVVLFFACMTIWGKSIFSNYFDAWHYISFRQLLVRGRIKHAWSCSQHARSTRRDFYEKEGFHHATTVYCNL